MRASSNPIAPCLFASILLLVGARAHAQGEEESPDPAEDGAVEPAETDAQTETEEEEGQPPEADAPERDEPPAEPPPELPVTERSDVGASVPPPPRCAAAARARAVDAVVRVRTGSNWGAGFVYRDSRHVVTAWSLMTLGRPVTVVARDGRAYATTLLTHDAALDIAVLELTEPIENARPLQPAPESAALLGNEVVAIGHPFASMASFLGERAEGLLRWSVSRGTIAAANDSALQVDVALAVGHAGGPALDCEGRVLGVVMGTGLVSADIGLVSRIGQVDALIDVAGQSSEFLGDMRLRLGLGASIVIDEAGLVTAGVYIALGGVLFDRISWMNRVGILFGGNEAPTPTELSVNRQLIDIESLLGYRFFLDIGGFTTFYIVPAGGLTVTFQSIDRVTAAVVPSGDPACIPSMTESCVMPTITRTTETEWIVRPAIGLNFGLGENLEIGYRLSIGLETDPVRTYHALRIGLLF